MLERDRRSWIEDQVWSGEGLELGQRHHPTNPNFEIFELPDFITAALLHLPSKGQQTVRYCGSSSNRTRDQQSQISDRIIRRRTLPQISSSKSPISNVQSEIFLGTGFSGDFEGGAIFAAMRAGVAVGSL